MVCIKRMHKLITTIACIISTESATEFTKFSIDKGIVEPMSGKSSFVSRGVHSGYQCALLCFQQNSPMCSFAAFNSTIGECELFFWKDVKSVRLLLNAEDVPPVADLYIGSDQKHMYIGSTLTYFAFTITEGKTYCERIGGRLANQTDLYTSRDNGWEICACGWLNDGASHFLVSENSASCSPTYWQCTPRTHVGVHCIID